MKVGTKIKNAAISTAINTALNYLEKDPENNAAKIMDLVDKLVPDDWYKGQRDAIRQAIEEKGNWFQLIQRIYALDPGVRKAFFTNFITNASLKGSARQEEVAKENNCNVPWAILLDPTSACNLKCTGCWAAEYGHKLNLTNEELDRVITEAKELGIHFFIMTGGEPMVRKKDIMMLAEKHNDCAFHIFTNGTLIDEEVCKTVQRLGNISFALSVEGYEETNDDRRGKGVFEQVMHAMDLMKQYGLIYGTSICYTSKNYKVVTSDEFLQMLVDKGAILSWYFHYMPVGKDASTDLLLTPEQREYMVERVRFIRSRHCPIKLFTLDFQNDAEFVGGCIAGGKNYLHINPNGDVEPCVFIHYSGANIHEKSLLECLQQPLFKEYHKAQPFNKNHLRPCPMLENPEFLAGMVERSGAHSTDLEKPESTSDVYRRCKPYADQWTPTADKLWKEAHPESKACPRR